MSIQSNVNQSLSMVGFLLSQTPQAAAARENAVKAQQIRKLKSEIGSTKELLQKDIPDREEYGKLLETQQKQLMELDPSAENIKVLKDLRGGPATIIEESPEELAWEHVQEQAAQEALQARQAERQSRFDAEVARLTGTATAEEVAGAKAQEAVASAQRKRRSFRQYMKGEQVDIAGHKTTFGSLSKEQQDAIMSSYTKKQKTEFMNRKDAEADVK